LTKQRDDLAVILAELCTDLEALPTRARDRAEMDKRSALEVSIRVVRGWFDLTNGAYPERLPLFDKLKARGYVPPPHTSWNPMAALFGPLPSVVRRVR
jgi:hypothetical protein